MSVRRFIKRGFFVTDTLTALPFEWRLLFAGLWTIADRDGRLEDRPRRIKGELFPYDDLDIEAGLGCLAHAGLIVRYERDGSRLIAIPTWHKHQQPHKSEPRSVLPAPPDGAAVPAVIGDHRRDRPAAPTLCDDHAPDGAAVPAVISTCTDLSSTYSAENSGSGSDRTSDQVVVRTHRARFEQFWTVYPRKVGKEAAWAVWERITPTEALTAQMIAAVEQQRTSPQWLKDGGQFIPHPRTWLSQGRWQDEPDQQPYLSARTVDVLRGLGRVP